MKLTVLLLSLLCLYGCAVRRVGSVSVRIGNIVVSRVTTVRDLAFTRDASDIVIQKTDEYVQPMMPQLATDSTLEETVISQTQFALDQHVLIFKTLYPEERTVTQEHLRWFAPTSTEYGGLILGSTPSGASVSLPNYGNVREGETTIRKVYPVGSYTFRLEKTRCKDVNVEVEIRNKENIVRIVSLECE